MSSLSSWCRNCAMSSAVAPSMPWSCRYWIPRFGFLLKLSRDERKTSVLVVSKHKHYHANPLLKPDPNVNFNQAEKKGAHSSMPCSMMSFCCLMTSYCSGWSAWEIGTLEETVESSELMLSRRPVSCSGSFNSPPSLSDGCSWPGINSCTHNNYICRLPTSPEHC